MKAKLIMLAISSRCIVIMIQAISNAMVPNHEPDVFRAVDIQTMDETWVDFLISISFNGLRHWDGEYFLHISEHLYTYENTLAFYPLFPFAIRHLSNVFGILSLPLSTRSLHLFIAVILNIVLFCKATIILYQLTLQVFNNPHKSWNAALLFCLNPAGIFFTAVYSETLFSLLCFYLMLESVSKLSFWRLTFSLCGILLCRSNGVLNIGFPIYFYTCDWLLSNSKSGTKLLYKITAMLILSFMPLALFYLYVFQQYCVSDYTIKLNPKLVDYGRKRNFVFANSPRGPTESPWCNSTFPFPYGYIQSHYWNVGFLRYYEWRQLPNFCVALPILLFLHSHCFAYLKNYIPQTLQKYKSKEQWKDYKTLPFILHVYILTIFCTFFVHIQVSTRLIASASPCLYWFAADYMPKTVSELKLCRIARWIIFWFGSYTILGTILFSNNFPWT